VWLIRRNRRSSSTPGGYLDLMPAQPGKHSRTP
jgi:hypothetical protein